MALRMGVLAGPSTNYWKRFAYYFKTSLNAVLYPSTQGGLAGPSTNYWKRREQILKTSFSSNSQYSLVRTWAAHCTHELARPREIRGLAEKGPSRTCHLLAAPANAASPRVDVNRTADGT